MQKVEGLSRPPVPLSMDFTWALVSVTYAGFVNNVSSKVWMLHVMCFFQCPSCTQSYCNGHYYNVQKRGHYNSLMNHNTSTSNPRSGLYYNAFCEMSTLGTQPTARISITKNSRDSYRASLVSPGALISPIASYYTNPHGNWIPRSTHGPCPLLALPLYM